MMNGKTRIEGNSELVIQKEDLMLLETRIKMRQLLKYYTEMTPRKEFSKNEVVKANERVGVIEGKPVKRLVIHLRSNGCGWKKSGGCSMCGFWAETSQMENKIEADNFVNQFEDILKRVDIRHYPLLCVYNAGSILNEKEVPFEALEKIVNIISQIPEIQQVALESRIEYIQSDKLLRLKKILKNKHLVIGIGLESANDSIRNICIHKGLNKKSFERKIELAHSIDVETAIYILIKPLFLTEAEAIEDAVNSTKYLLKLDIKNIHYETMTIEDYTLAHTLFRRGLYQLPWLWSIIEIIEQVSPMIKPFVSPFSYIREAEALPHNCDYCTEFVKKALLEDYCSSYDLSRLRSLNCTCRSLWLKELEKKDELPVEERVLKTISGLYRELEIRNVE
jgi:radical SAM enzyme (TIGR01210 family)